MTTHRSRVLLLSAYVGAAVASTLPRIIANYTAPGDIGFAYLSADSEYLYAEVSNVGPYMLNLHTIDTRGVWEGRASLATLSRRNYTTLYDQSANRYTTYEGSTVLYPQDWAGSASIDTANRTHPTVLSLAEGGYRALCFFESNGRTYFFSIGSSSVSSMYFFTADVRKPNVVIGKLDLTLVNQATQAIYAGGYIFYGPMIFDVRDVSAVKVAYAYSYGYYQALCVDWDKRMQYQVYGVKRSTFLLSYDIRNPSAPTMVSNHTLADWQTNHTQKLRGINSYYMSRVGEVVYTLVNWVGIIGMNMSDPAHPKPEASMTGIMVGELQAGFETRVIDGTVYALVAGVNYTNILFIALQQL